MNQKLALMISSSTIFVACVGLDSKIRKAKTKSTKNIFLAQTINTPCWHCLDSYPYQSRSILRDIVMTNYVAIGLFYNS